MAHAYEIELGNCGPLRLTLESRPPRWLNAMFAVVTALVIAALAWSWLCKIDVVVAAPGRLRPTATPIAVAPGVDPSRGIGGNGSRVAAVNVEAGARVRKGEVLAVLDTRALELEIADLHTEIAGKTGELALIEMLIEQQRVRLDAERERVEAEIEQNGRQTWRDEKTRRIDLSNTSTTLTRVRQRERDAEKLVADGHMNREELEEIRRERRALEADTRKLGIGTTSSVEVLRRAGVVLERSADVERTELRLRAASVSEALRTACGALARRQLALAEASLRAPIDGVVTQRNLEVGALLDPKLAAFVIAPTDGLLFEAVLDSKDAGHVEVGMPARIAIDTFDAQKYGMVDGTVVYVSADSAADEGAGLRYLVRVEVPTEVLGRGDDLAELRLGLGGRVEVLVGHERVLALLLDDLEDRFDMEWAP
ncbi:MAG: HlyD family secretion protein [Nannocystaceae bacterium]|nr:HlyD family secretion protein [Nannocystaceae bacterium]